jgi:hypothetical protein
VTATVILQRDDLALYHASWEDLLDAAPRRDDGTIADTLIVDAPFSKRTHAGHDGRVLVPGATYARRAGTNLPHQV